MLARKLKTTRAGKPHMRPNSSESAMRMRESSAIAFDVRGIRHANRIDDAGCVMRYLMLLAVLVAAPLGAQDAPQAIDPKLVPVSGATTGEFVPPGWKVARQITGALTSSAQPDVVLQLADEDTSRGSSDAMLILSRTPAGGLQRVALAGKLMGPLIAEVVDVRIVKGVLIVSQGRGARLQRFRYEPQSKQFLLIGEDIITSWMNGRSEIVSTNFLTGNQIISKRRYDEHLEKDVVVSTQTNVVERIQRPIDQVEYSSDVPSDAYTAPPTAPSTARVLVITRIFNDTSAPITAPGRFVGVPRILLEQLQQDLGDDDMFPRTLDDLAAQLVTSKKLELVDPRTPASDRQFPSDAEFYWLSGPHAFCGSAGCTGQLYWASLATKTSGWLMDGRNTEITILPQSTNGLFDLDIDGPMKFDGQQYIAGR